MVHAGLFGHVDSGKTAIAARLSEIISTAGLDAHPQAKKRGISIDLGFTSFDLEGYKVALVDAPGHADLIRSVVASANIIEVAVLVIDVMKGPEVQTGEHMVILESLGIKRVVVALNKVDMVATKADLVEKATRVEKFLAATGPPFAGAPVVYVSAKDGTGFDDLRAALLAIIETLPPAMAPGDDPLVMPVDHHFRVKGFGTVLTGTVTSGKVSIGDVIEVVPLSMTGKVKSIQVFKEPVKHALAGDRAGVAVVGIDDSRLYRGCVACTPGTMGKTRHLIIEGTTVPQFKHPVTFKSAAHVTVAMATVPAMVYPFEFHEGVMYKIDEVGSSKAVEDPVAPAAGIGRGGNFHAYVATEDPIPCKAGLPLLLTRLDLPASGLRIAARGTVRDVLDGPPSFRVTKEKRGRVKDGSRGVVEGIAMSQEGAKRLVGTVVVATWYIDDERHESRGKIITTFGTKGVVKVAFEGATPPDGSEVLATYWKTYKV